MIRTALAALALACAALPAHAQPQDRGDWFKSLKQPGSNLSCCDISDCKKTQAKWQGDGWVAIVRGYPRAIPPERVLKTPWSIDGDAYVCASEFGDADKATIYCFVPPVMGY